MGCCVCAPSLRAKCIHRHCLTPRITYSTAYAVRDAFSTLYPAGYVAVVPAVDPHITTALAAEREALLVALECARWELDHSKRISLDGGVTLGRRPTHRVGFLGLVGRRVDSIQAYEAQLEEVSARLAAARAAVLRGAATPDAPARSAAYVTFATARDAAIAAQVQLSRDPFTWRLAPAPPPADVVWANAGRMPPLLRQAATYVTLAATYALVVFYMIPIAAISALSTLSNLVSLLPFLKPVVEVDAVRALLEGLLPGLALIIFLAVLPGVLRALAAARGVRTHSGTDAAELRGMFLFAAINVFLGNVLAGSVFAGLKRMIDHPTGILSLLASTVPQTSRFFISFVALKALGGAASEVGCLSACAMYLLRTRALGARRTPRREAAAWAPKAASLGSELSENILVLLLVVVFSTIAPLVHCVGILYFALRLGAVKARVMYRHEASYEGAAAIWSPTRNRVCAVLLIYQATLAGVFGLKRAPVPAGLLLGGVMPLTAAVMRILGERFDPATPGTAPPPLSWFTPVQSGEAPPPLRKAGGQPPTELEEDAVDPTAKAYLPPGLQPQAHLELDACGGAPPQEQLFEPAVEGTSAAPIQRTRSAGIIESAVDAADAAEEGWHSATDEQPH